jgi:hypothetical protein
VEELLPESRDLPKQPDGLPSRNLLMRTFKIGAPKADEIRSLLAAEKLAETLAAAASDPAEGETDRWTVEQIRDALELDTERAEHVHGVLSGAVNPWGSSVPIVDVLAPDPVDTRVSGPPATVVPSTTVAEPTSQADRGGHPGTPAEAKPARPVAVWPVWLLMIPAFVAVWAGWVGLGQYTGFGRVNLLPGIAPEGGFATIDSAITLPVGMEVFAAYALYVWLSGRVPDRARRFAMGSALVALSLGALGQIAYHLLAAPPGGAPWEITTAVACLPVAVLGMGAALAHMVRGER